MESVLDSDLLHVGALVRRAAKTRDAERAQERRRDDETCMNCKTHACFLIDTRSATRVCTVCGESVVWQDMCNVDTRGLSTSTRVKRPVYAYKHMNHMFLWMRQVQGKENRHVPEEVYTVLAEELCMRKIDPTDTRVVTPKLIRGLMQYLRLPRYYHNLVKVYIRLTGAPAFLDLSLDDECRVMKLFQQVMRAFETLKKEGVITRKNMLSYPFMLDKLLLWLGIVHGDGLGMWIPLLIHKDKFMLQERDWDRIKTFICLNCADEIQGIV